MQTTGFILLGLIVLFTGSCIILLRFFMSKTNQTLVDFYRRCDDIRDEIHKANTQEECSRILKTLEGMEESVIKFLPVCTTQKEVNLLYRLLEKKKKKI